MSSVIPAGSAGLICRYSTIDKQVYMPELRVDGLRVGEAGVTFLVSDRK